MNEATGSRVIHSRPGLWSTLNTAAIFTVGAGMVILAFLDAIESGFGSTLVIAVVIGVPLMLVAASGFTLRLRVERDRIDKWDMWGHRSVRWADVREIQISPTYFGTFGFIIYLSNGVRRLTLLVPFIGNRIEVARAILEAATLANPAVVVNAPLGSPYGQPPYGLFGSERETPGN